MILRTGRHWRRLVLLVLSLAVFALFVGATSNGAAQPVIGAMIAHGHRPTFVQSGKAGPPTDAQCRTNPKYKAPCYSPQEMRAAYDVQPLLDQKFDGTGQTIIIIDSFGSPTIQADLATFDTDYGIAAPPAFDIATPAGTIPTFDPTNNDMVGWAEETTLDVEWAHAMAPGAHLVLLESPVSETQGVQGMPEFLTCEQYALQHYPGGIISQSWGTTEETLLADDAGKAVFANFEAFYTQAAQANMTVFASAGDSGVGNQDTAGNTYPFPTVIYPASSPQVTAVGGTSLYASVKGKYKSEVVWNKGVNGGITGGGVSHNFTEPDYQKNTLPKADQKELKGMRGLPDIAYNADPATSILIYLSFLGQANAGYYGIGGTSEGAPQWAGIMADINDFAGKSLGFINPTLYSLGTTKGHNALFHDVTRGNNTYAPKRGKRIVGFKATQGWDADTGFGSPKVAALAAALKAANP